MGSREPWVYLENVTIEDLIDMMTRKERYAIINDGQLLDIVYPEYGETAIGATR